MSMMSPLPPLMGQSSTQSISQNLSQNLVQNLSQKAIQNVSQKLSSNDRVESNKDDGPTFNLGPIKSSGAVLAPIVSQGNVTSNYIDTTASAYLGPTGLGQVSQIHKIEQYGSPFSPNRNNVHITKVSDINTINADDHASLFADIPVIPSSVASSVGNSAFATPVSISMGHNFNTHRGMSEKDGSLSTTASSKERGLKSVRSIRQMALFNYSR